MYRETLIHNHVTESQQTGQLMTTNNIGLEVVLKISKWSDSPDFFTSGSALL